jgi:hypothetical protein
MKDTHIQESENRPVWFFHICSWGISSLSYTPG